jgi:hypothetical protein
MEDQKHLAPGPVGAAEGCDLLIFEEPPKSKIKRSQPSAAPTDQEEKISV